MCFKNNDSKFLFVISCVIKAKAALVHLFAWVTEKMMII
ncbi:putative membrane protein [Klebsiella oxytoca]|nr:putative membrane protein [Klebsiella oxytoca]